MTQLTTFEEFVEVVKTNPTLRTQLFEALGLLALGAAQQEAITELVALRKDVDGLVTRVDGLDVKVDGLVTKVDGLDVKVDGLVTKVDRLGTDVHSLNSVVLGGELEEKASNVVYSQLRSLTSAKLRAITLRYSTRRSLQPDNDSYTSPVDDAVGADTITGDEEMRLIRTDLVFSASVETAEGWETRWFPVEVSRVIGNKDVTRVTKSAEAIAKVFSQKVEVALVAGTGIHREAKALANASGVKVVEFEIDGDDGSD